MSSIEQEVRQFVVDNLLYGSEREQFTDDDSFFEKGLVDSMGTLTLIQFVQDRYAIPVEDAELVPEHWDSVRRIAEFVERKRAAAAPLAGGCSEGRSC